MVNETKSSNRTLLIVLAVGALALALVVGIIIVTLVLGGDESGEGAAVAKSAELMPQSTLSFGTFNPHLDQAKNFEVIDKAWGQNPLIKMGLLELVSSMKEGGLDYETDIAPWLGDEISFGMMGDFSALMLQGVEMGLDGIPDQIPQMGEMSEIPEFIIAVATKEQAASDKFLDKLRSEVERDGTVLQETEYEGIKIIHSAGTESEPSVAYASMDDFVVLAVGGLESMQAVIDTKGGDSLADNENYKDVMAKLPPDQIGYGYLDTETLIDAMLQAVGSELEDIPADLFDPDSLKAFKGVGFSVGFESNGLRFDSVVVYDKTALPENMPGTQASSGKTAGRVPSSALLYLSSSGLGSVVQIGLDAIMAMPDQPADLDEQLSMVTAMLGVSVEDLIEMLSGEFGLAITHDSNGIAGDPSIPVGASFLIEAEDEAKFEQLLNSLATLLTFGAEMEFPKETISGVEVMTVPDPSTGNLIVGWGVGEGYLAIGSSKELLEAAFGGGGETLSDAATYKAATEPLPENSAGVFFVNLEGLLKIVGEAMSPWDRESFDQALPFFAPIKAISAAIETFDKDKDSASGTLFILIESE